MNRTKFLITFLGLFTSSASLLCCALPALLVALGLGATLAGFLGAFPQLIWISQNKIWVFFIGALLLLIAGIFQVQARTKACPIDKEKALACDTSRRWSKGIYFSSIGLYCIGAFFAFVWPMFL